MRKLMWCGVGLCAVGLAGAYFAACHAARHPDSFLARCANLASYVGARCSPLLTLGQPNTRPAKSRTMAAPVQCEQEQVIAIFDGGSDVPREPVEPIVVEPVDPGLVPEKLKPEALPPPETEEPASAFASEPRVPFMPYADVPGTLVRQTFFGPGGSTTGGSPEPDLQTTVSPSQALVDACWSWISSALGACQAEQEVCPAACFIRMSVQPFHELVKALHSETANEIENQVEQTRGLATPPVQPEPPPALFPQLFIDPHHHQHYPSCPYTGRCPPAMPNGRSIQPLPTPEVTPVSPVPRNVATPETSSQPKPPKKWLYLLSLRGPAKPATIPTGFPFSAAGQELSFWNGFFR